MNIELIILVIISIICCVYGLYLLSSMPSVIMKNMEIEVKERIKENDKKYEEQEKFYYELKKWLFR